MRTTNSVKFFSKQSAIGQEIWSRSNVLGKHSLNNRHVAALTDTSAPHHRDVQRRLAETARGTKESPRSEIVFFQTNVQKEELSRSCHAKSHDIRDNVLKLINPRGKQARRSYDVSVETTLAVIIVGCQLYTTSICEVPHLASFSHRWIVLS